MQISTARYMTDTNSSVRQVRLHSVRVRLFGDTITLWERIPLAKLLPPNMQWLNFKPKGEALSEIHKGRQEVLASPCKIHVRKQNI